MAATAVQTSLPPAQPSYVFRGHTAQVHCVCFVRQNSRLLTGDADGWVVLWKLASKRPVAVWQAHDAAILGLAAWGAENIITHGRDNSLKVWQLRLADEQRFSNVPPADNLRAVRPQPWLLHSLGVNTLNFCSFSMCFEQPASAAAPNQSVSGPGYVNDGATDSILVAVPGTDDKKVDIFQLPSEQRIHTVPRVMSTDTGMVMALKIIHHSSRHLLLLTGYESGHTAIHQLEAPTPDTPKAARSAIFPTWHLIYLSKPHSQPVLSLDEAPDTLTFFTSSADAIVAAHRIPDPVTLEKGRVRPPPSASVSQKQGESASAQERRNASFILQTAHRISNTKHAGQQSLHLRSDGRILATAGWDGRVRVYSTKSLKELAVLKWHREGVYGLAFAEIQKQPPIPTKSDDSRSMSNDETEDDAHTVRTRGYMSPYETTSSSPPTTENSSTEDQGRNRGISIAPADSASSGPATGIGPTEHEQSSYPIHLPPFLTSLDSQAPAIPKPKPRPYISPYNAPPARMNAVTPTVSSNPDAAVAAKPSSTYISPYSSPSRSSDVAATVEKVTTTSTTHVSPYSKPSAAVSAMAPDTSLRPNPILPLNADDTAVSKAAKGYISPYRATGTNEGAGIGSLPQLDLRREEVEMGRHWIAAGSKDGKVSLWVVY